MTQQNHIAHSADLSPRLCAGLSLLFLSWWFASLFRQFIAGSSHLLAACSSCVPRCVCCSLSLSLVLCDLCFLRCALRLVVEHLDERSVAHTGVAGWLRANEWDEDGRQGWQGTRMASMAPLHPSYVVVSCVLCIAPLTAARPIVRVCVCPV